jgi:hypothetical protein
LLFAIFTCLRHLQLTFQVGRTIYHLRLFTIHVPVVRRADVNFTT